MKKIANFFKWILKIVIATLICIFVPCLLCVLYNDYFANFIIVFLIVIAVVIKKATDEENY